MKNLILTLVVLGIAQITMLEPLFAARKPYPVHILPDQTIENPDQLIKLASESNASDYISEALRVGKKNMDWLKHMNSFLPDGQKIALTKPGELTPIPIDKPKVYSPKTVETDFNVLFDTIPESMKRIIFGTAPFSDTPTEDLETYRVWAKSVDKMYQTAARWQTMQPYMLYYKQNKTSDIRGYYYLSREENLDSKIQNFSSLSQEEQDRLTPYLVNICENDGSLNVCPGILKRAIANGTLKNYVDTYWPISKETFDRNFSINGVRTDIRWTQNEPGKAYIPVRITESVEVNQFLEYNIEDEWKWNGWQLDLEMTSNADVHVEFEAGATPHVNGLGGNTITMDANAPLTEWDVQWTIRHEFGHVLGFDDCYVEFYDNNLQAMVNYQIDTTNMMCSRAGRMQELHYTEMKKAYFH